MTAKNPIREEWTSADGQHRILWGDCLEILPTLDTSEVAAVLADPPYGMNYDTDLSGFNGWGGKGHKCEPIIGDDTQFDPSPWLAIGKKHVFWGAQYFCHRLPQVGGWLVFNKRGDGKPSEICFGDAELAWCDAMQSVRMYSQIWHGVSRWSTEGRLHPTQKPVALMIWCLSFLPPGLILDPYAGSCTVAVACARTGRRSISIEIEERYFRIGIERMEREAARHPLLEPKKPTQTELF